MARKRRQPKEIEVQATVNIAGLRAGRIVKVDPRLPWVQRMLANGCLQATDPHALTPHDGEEP